MRESPLRNPAMSSDDFLGEKNPYRSPLVQAAPLGGNPLVAEVESAWLFRSIRLAPPLVGTIVYDGRFGIELVYVDDRCVGWGVSNLHSRFSFTLPTPSGELIGSVEACISLWFTLSPFVVRLGEEEIYAER